MTSGRRGAQGDGEKLRRVYIIILEQQLRNKLEWEAFFRKLFEFPRLVNGIEKLVVHAFPTVQIIEKVNRHYTFIMQEPLLNGARGVGEGVSETG